MSDMINITETDITFSACDGFLLSGRLVLPDHPESAVLISSAKGFPREFYLPFARYGAARKAACVSPPTLASGPLVIKTFTGKTTKPPGRKSGRRQSNHKAVQFNDCGKAAQLLKK